MRRLSCLVALSFLALLVVVPSAGAQQSAPKTWSVAIEDFYFEPADAAIQPGDTIVWTNEGNTPHTVTSDDGQFDSEALNPGDSFMVTFSGQGTLTYHCEIHPSMTGSVTVGGAAPTGETSAPATPAGGEAMDMSNMSMGSSY
jgi:plastocyanin